MHINHFFTSILFLIESLSFINPIMSSLLDNNSQQKNETMTWLIFSTSSSRRYDWKRRFRKHLEPKAFNLTDVRTTSSTSETRLFSASNGASKFNFDLDLCLQRFSFRFHSNANQSYRNCCSHH